MSDGMADNVATGRRAVGVAGNRVGGGAGENCGAHADSVRPRMVPHTIRCRESCFIRNLLLQTPALQPSGRLHTHICPSSLTRPTPLRKSRWIYPARPTTD